MNIAGECKTCGHIYDVTTTVGCPACRMARVQEMFKPVDSLRTAFGMKMENWEDLSDAQREMIRSHSTYESRYYRPHMDYPGRLCTPDGKEPVPKDCKMPKYADDQIFELRRMFRL